MKSEISLVELVIALVKRRRVVTLVPFAMGAVAAAISFAMPNVYLATTTLLPPQQSQSGAAALLSQLGGMASVGSSGIGALKNPSDLYVGILKSRTVADRLIRKFRLEKVYDTEYTEETRKKLAENTRISSSKEGLITIEVEDRKKELVAQLANGYVAEFQRVSKEMALTEAGQRRLFYEQQLEAAKNNLAKAETALKGTMDARGVISVDVESRAVVETIARLRAEISAKEIQLNALSASLTATHPDYQRVAEQLKSLRGELAKLENGRGANPDNANESGSRGLESIQMLRDIKYYQMLYELLAKQYEAARLDEAKEVTVVQVLDPAVEPERKYKPRRALIVLLSTIVGLFVAVLWVVFLELKERAMAFPEAAARWNQLTLLFKLR